MKSLMTVLSTCHKNLDPNLWKEVVMSMKKRLQNKVQQRFLTDFLAN